VTCFGHNIRDGTAEETFAANNETSHHFVSLHQCISDQARAKAEHGNLLDAVM
jgi:hypothetical protein